MLINCAFSAVAAMDVDKAISELEMAIHHAVISLTRIARDFLHKDIELLRICRLGVLLKESGVNPNTVLFRKIAEKCVKMQRDDGGWSDVTETMWCARFLNLTSEYVSSVEKAINWLNLQCRETQGWGKSIRDSARIPISGLILYLLPQLSSNVYLKWLENKWKKELEYKPCLNYKAAFTLMAFRKNNYHPEDNEIILKTVRWLADQQNNDGGWGPWKDHPMGSDPWCTGICMISLLHYLDEVPQKALRNGLEWIKEKQLPNGLWAYHYIEDGSAWAVYALTMGYGYLSRRKN